MNNMTRPAELDLRLDLNLFRVFAAVHSQGSLTRAANVLALSQPAVSNALARLRTHFDDPLFVRVAGGMQATVRAKQIAPDIYRALSLLQASTRAEESFDPTRLQRRFRLLMGDQLEAVLMPSLVETLREKAPGVRFDVASLERSELTRELAGQADFAVDALVHTDPRLESTLLMTDEYLCVMRPEHPLARGRLTLERYLEAEHIHTSSRRRGAGHIDIALRKLGKQRRIVYRTQHYLEAQFMLERSDFLLSASSRVAALFKQTVKPLPFVVEPTDINLYWHRGELGDPGHEWLREQITKIAL